MVNRSRKLEELKALRDILNIKVEGMENYPSGPSMVVANHNCLMDIFYLPAAILEPTVSVISPRLIYKPILERQSMVNRYLYAMPVEAHGGLVYSNMCLQQASSLLASGVSLNMFPEGAYVEQNNYVYRGRTGAARILFQSREHGVQPYLVPVAIDIRSEHLDLDSYAPSNDAISITILEPIDYEQEFEQYEIAQSVEDKNKILHQLMDKSLSNIAQILGKTYSSEYIPLFPKRNVMFNDGSVVDLNEAQRVYYISLYQKQLHERANEIKKQLIKSR